MPKDVNGQIRQKILQSALEEFSSLGFDGATVRGIAARGGVTHGMIRYYYSTKEQLWFEAVSFLFKRLENTLALDPKEAKRLEDGDLDVFRKQLRRYVYYCARHPEHARILMQETVTPSARMRKALEENLKDAHQRVKDLFQVMQAKQLLPADAPTESIIYMITGACQNIFALAPELQTTLGYDALQESAIEAHADLIVQTFCPVSSR